MVVGVDLVIGRSGIIHFMGGVISLTQMSSQKYYYSTWKYSGKCDNNKIIKVNLNKNNTDFVFIIWEIMIIDPSVCYCWKFVIYVNPCLKKCYTKFGHCDTKSILCSNFATHKKRLMSHAVYDVGLLCSIVYILYSFGYSLYIKSWRCIYCRAALKWIHLQVSLYLY